MKVKVDQGRGFDEERVRGDVEEMRDDEVLQMRTDRRERRALFQGRGVCETVTDVVPGRVEVEIA